MKRFFFLALMAIAGPIVSAQVAMMVGDRVAAFYNFVRVIRGDYCSPVA